MKESAQQRWNDSNPEKVLKAKRKYNQKQKIIGIRVNKQQEPELVEWYEGLTNEQKRKVSFDVIEFLKNYKQEKYSDTNNSATDNSFSAKQKEHNTKKSY